MIVSTRGRYALRVMLYLARSCGDNYIPLKDIAAAEDISLKYLEGIMSSLSKAKLVDGAHGKGGGYKLAKSPDKYTVGDILRLTERSLTPVDCPEFENESCKHAEVCLTLPMWLKLDRMINEFFDGITLSDLIEKREIQ